MFNWDAFETSVPWVKGNTILLAKAGSHAYGTATPASDEDYRGICISPIDYYLGTLRRFEQFETKEPDLVIYDIRKYVRLASQANPNVLEILFTEPSDLVVLETWGAFLISMRNMFLSKRVRHTYSGYAVAQLRKIKQGAKLVEAAENLDGLSERQKREAEHGYDPKNGMHLVRLLRMCREILETGQVNVRRKDADELLAIRNGAWSLKELTEYAEYMDAGLDAIAAKSQLPDEPDAEKIDAIIVSMLRDLFGLWH